jgi:hypothetical protein
MHVTDLIIRVKVVHHRFDQHHQSLVPAAQPSTSLEQQAIFDWVDQVRQQWQLKLIGSHFSVHALPIALLMASGWLIPRFRKTCPKPTVPLELALAFEHCAVQRVAVAPAAAPLLRSVGVPFRLGTFAHSRDWP